jgi:hypothetical protein
MSASAHGSADVSRGNFTRAELETLRSAAVVGKTREKNSQMKES